MEKLSDIRSPLPPSESVLEDLFWHYMRATVGGLANCTSQFEISPFRVDAIFDCSGTAVVIELDGKEYHDWRRDDARDAILLNQVGEIIRIPYRAMKFYPFATLRVLSLWRDRFEAKGDTRTMGFLELQRFYNRECTELPNYEQEEWFYQFDATIEVYACSGSGSDSGVVGSPREFLKQGRPVVITRRRGHTTNELLTRLRSTIAQGNR